MSEQDRQIIEAISQLPAEGKIKVLDYARGMVALLEAQQEREQQEKGA